MEESIKKEILEWVKSFAFALVIVLVIKFFIFDITPIENISMQPTLYEKDRVFLNIIGYKLGKIERGDVVIFTPPIDKKSYYIKRVIALPGETITIKGGKVYINDVQLDEKYLPAGTVTSSYTGKDFTLKVPEGMVFLMGDNRPNSEDSREFGPVSEKAIRGHAEARIYPFNAIKKL